MAMTKHRLAATALAALMFLTLTVPLQGLAANKPVLYTAVVTMAYGADSGSGIYPTPDVQKPNQSTRRLGTLRAGSKLEVVDVLPNYVEINYKGGTGFILRKRIDKVVALDPSTTPPYGVVPFRYFSTLDKETPVMAAPDTGAEVLITLQKGARLAFIDMENGWAKLIFKRQYGYVNTALLPDLQMVAPSPEGGDSQTPIAVYTSFYNIATNDANLNRMINLEVCGQRMARVMQPGEMLDFNKTVGPFHPRYGYKTAPGLVDGELVDSTGGGSCQASSTLYNVVLQLTGLTVTARAPHGNDGAPYLPHGVDASSGDLNFIFRNDYSFPIRIDYHVQDGAYFIAIYREVAA
ncbi:MAG: hypothetical protein GX650_08400 [Clostridiales bacterium]|jgi:hypothetical protein|nr:hypothetical protein [Clostridiales bacterium]